MSFNEWTDMRQRFFCYLLMGLLSPAILFAFVMLFGADSYQYWGDRYHYDLTNKFLFSRLPHEGLLGPLWRDETLAGHVWIVSLVTSPLALDVLAARWLHLSPLGIELVGNLTLYFAAVVSMFWYVRRALGLSMEPATAAAVMFASTAYWVCSLAGNPDGPMPAAWLPALLAMTHEVEASCERRRSDLVLLTTSGLALLFYGCALNSSLASLPVFILFLVSYAIVVVGWNRSLLWVFVALGTGLILYSPFFWVFFEASRISHRNVESGFYSHASFGLDQWLAQGKIMLSQVALGHNRYGVYLVTVLAFLVWLCLGRRWSQEPPRIRKILLFAAVATVATYLIEFFHAPINSVKRTIPILGGWDVTRFSIFSFLGLITIVGWIFDRTFFRPISETLSPIRRVAVRGAIAASGVIGGLQIAYSAVRMREVPTIIYPQNLVLYAYLALYTVVTFSFLIFLYQGTRQRFPGFRICLTDSSRLWCVGFIVLSVSLATSVHAYRSGFVRPQGIEVKADAAPIMTYAQRYAVPDEVLVMKRLDAGEGRVLDLTRPLNSGTWLLGSEITLLPLVGLRVLSGYSNLYPAWYGRLIHVGINGKSGSPWNIIQVEDTGHTNFKILPLLDVEYVLTRRGMVLPGYRPVVELDSSGKMLSQVEAGSRLGPAFVATSIRCFQGDEEALEAIHAATLSEILAHAVLVASDPASQPLCGAKPVQSMQASPAAIRSTRGRDRVRIEVENSPGGVLTLSDTYYSGWRVYVNGVERPLLRTYTALRGVVIEPGRQTVEFVFAPSTFNRLLMISAVCLAALALVSLVLWAGRWKDRRAAA